MIRTRPAIVAVVDATWTQASSAVKGLFAHVGGGPEFSSHVPVPHSWLLPIPELFSQLPEHLLARNGLHSSAANIIYPAFDLFVSSRLNSRSSRLVIETLSQTINQ